MHQHKKNPRRKHSKSHKQKRKNKAVVLRSHIEANRHPKQMNLSILLTILPTLILYLYLLSSNKQKSILEVMYGGQKDYLEIELKI